MTRYFFLIVLYCMAGMSVPVLALQYYPDPIYRKLNAEDVVPMQDIIDMATQGDVRAQFIMGDLYSKGKGGLAKNIAESRRWFETSAIHGYYNSFIRLAAMAKNDGNPEEAWQWYTLAINGFDSGPERAYSIQARDALVEEEKMTREDIRNARKAMREWEDKRDDQLRAERDAAREAARAERAQEETPKEPEKNPEVLEKEGSAPEKTEKEPVIIIDTTKRTIIVGEEDEQN